MEKTKLIHALKSLNKEETRQFRHYLSCKLFNKREVPILLLECILFQLKKSRPNLQKEFIFKQLFPDKPFSETEFRYLMSYLSVPLYRFLAFQKLYLHREDESIAMCHALRDRGLLKQFEIALNRATSLQQQSPLRDGEYYYRHYKLEQERYYASTQKGRAETTNLLEVTNSLDIHYYTQRLRQSCYMISHQNMYNISYDSTVVDHILDEVKRKELLQIPAISIYYYCYLALAHPDQVHFFKALKQLLIVKAELFTISEMKDIYLLAINIAIKRYNQGHREIATDLLDLYQSGIDQKILLTNNILSRFTYKNVVVLALTQKLFDWAESFVKNYYSLLEKDYQEVMYQYNLAKLHAEKKEFDSALQYLMLTNNSDDVYINIDTKMLLARIYHEQGNLDAQLALVESFRKILNRKKKILGYHYLSYKNYLQCINKMTTLNPYDSVARALLLEEIKNTKSLPDKHWFLEQLSAVS